MLQSEPSADLSHSVFEVGILSMREQLVLLELHDNNIDVKQHLNLVMMSQDLPSVPEQSTTRGRITIYCIAESLNRVALEKRLRDQGPKCLVQAYPDVSSLADGMHPLHYLHGAPCHLKPTGGHVPACRCCMDNSSSQDQKLWAISFTLTMAA